MQVREAKLKRVVLDEAVENQVKEKLKLFAAASLPANTAAQLNEACVCFLARDCEVKRHGT
jgi:hypothetical protein